LGFTAFNIEPMIFTSNTKSAVIKRPPFSEILNFLGSLASVTGVSLLWLKGSGTLDLETIAAVAVSASAVLGLASFLVWALFSGYRRYLIQSPVALRLAYFALGGPVCLFVGALLAAIANKLFLSIPWSWFFHG
jgi:hypothetical protein